MNLTTEQDKTSLLDRIGTCRALEAYVVGAAFLDGGVLAAALGDGRVAFIGGESADASHFVSVYDGACLSLSVDLVAGPPVRSANGSSLRRSAEAGFNRNSRAVS